MAGWRDSMNRMAASAVAKSKEVAEITRLNVEIGNLEQRVRDRYLQMGEYICGHPEVIGQCADETVQEILQAVQQTWQQIETDRQQIRDIRNVNICPNCGAEVSRSNKFCDQCGTPMDRSVLEPEPQQGPVCPSCGEPVEPDATFCGNCGARLK